MDNLMLTNGWRRFRWEDVLQEKKPSFAFLPEYAGHIVAGRITRTATGRPGKDIAGLSFCARYPHQVPQCHK